MAVNGLTSSVKRGERVFGFTPITNLPVVDAKLTSRCRVVVKLGVLHNAKLKEASYAGLFRF